MKVIRISKKPEEKDYTDEFEASLEEDGMTSEEEAFVRGWEG